MISKLQIKKLLRKAEGQCLIWGLSNDPNSKVELARWEKEYKDLEELIK